MKRYWAYFFASFASAQGLASEHTNLWDLSLLELSSIEVTRLATGSPTPLSRAAAITTVISAKDIRNMGATDIDQALMSVPGLYVSRSDQSYTPMYIFRGIYSRFNAQALFMVNGIPQKNLPIGNRGHVWGGMPVEAIEKIEIIRGPGSALYGADAFAGIINIITKTGEEMAGTQVGVSAGSFDTYQAWVQHGGEYSDWDIAFSLEAGSTNGHQETIEADSQTVFDSQFSTNASYAPGPINTGYDSLELRLDAGYEAWHFRLGYQKRENLESGAGIAGALDPNGSYNSDRVNADVTFTQDDWLDDWSLVTQFSVYFDNQELQDYPYLFPPGAFGGVYPDGFIGAPEYKEVQATLQEYGVYTGWEDHRLRFAVGVKFGDVFETTELKNFNSDFTPKSGLVDVSDTNEVWLPEKSRKLHFISIQDEWQINPDWQLVSGVRYDHYSDFGDTINPRLALVWLTTEAWTTRLLYGRAFRAPSFTELYVISNPVILGNIQLDPETIDTYELAFHHQLDSSTEYSFNFFYYEIDDFILYEDIGNNANLASNIGKRNGRGAEVEWSHSVSDILTLQASYAYQESIDKSNQDDVGGAPNHQAYARADWAFANYWNLTTEIHWFGSVEREPGDARTEVASATLWNINLRRTQLWQNWEFAVAVRNLLDEDIRTPSQPAIPDDYPAPGLNGTLSLRYQFD